MKPNCLTLFLVSTLLGSTSLDAFSQETMKPALNNSNSPEEVVKSSRVVAVVDGKAITEGQLDELAFAINPNWSRISDEQRRVTVLKICLDAKALAKAAIKEGLDKTEAYDKHMAIMRDNVLQRLYHRRMIVDKITDADLKVLYDKEVATFPKEDEVKARHILVKTVKEAEAIISRLNKGEKFEEIAKKDSTDSSAAVGGDLGYFSRGQMVKSFEDAAFALKVGGHTKKPVESPFGWHVIKVEDRRLKQPPAFDDVRDELRAQLTKDRYRKLIVGLRNQLDVKYPDPDVAKQMQSHNENE